MQVRFTFRLARAARAHAPTQRALRCALGVLSAGAVGCSQLVELGSQCPDPNQDCVVSDDASVPAVDANTVPHDGNGVPVVDATQPPPVQDAMTSSDPVFPVIGNPGFDIVSGAAGDVTTLSSTNIAPWYTCQPIGGGANPTTGVRAETSVTLTSTETPAGATVTARDGSSSFINMQFLVQIVPIPLLQKMTLTAGTPYALAMDAQPTNPDAQLSLQLRGTSSDDDCLGSSQNNLAASNALTTPSWQTVCLAFTPSTDFTHLVITLKSGAILTSTLTGGRVLFDNLRPATRAECPELF